MLSRRHFLLKGFLKENILITKKVSICYNPTEFEKVSLINMGMIGWCDGPGLTSGAGASYSVGDSRTRSYCACSRCGWWVVWTFVLSSILFSPLSPSLWETARYRLKYCLKGPLKPKQPTNQLINKGVTKV